MSRTLDRLLLYIPRRHGQFLTGVLQAGLTFATRAMRLGSSVQLSGRNSRRSTITGTSREASVTETSDWQLAVLPSTEAY